MSLLTAVFTQGWPAPKGYANGIVTERRLVHVGGQIGWRPDGTFAAGLLPQIEQALKNVVTVVEAAGAGPIPSRAARGT